MNILVLGSGGREHALSWKISQSPHCSKLFIAPGNAGTHEVGINVDISVNDFESISQFIERENIELVVIGPEDPLVNGLRDYLEDKPETSQVSIVGPGKDGARLEGSKDYSKLFMNKYGIPTGRFETFSKDNLSEGKSFLQTMKAPYVLKADGLAAGKGVLICNTLQEAEDSLEDMLLNEKFGEASSRVLIEEYLDGIELSVFVLSDGTNYVILPEAKDYKRIGEGDTGLNTGGMGAISPVPFAGEEFLKKVEERVVEPTVKGLKNEGIDYKGFIFIGLMNVGGDPYVIEYNVRMGDPETQVVIPRIESDLVELLNGAGKGNLANGKISISEKTATTVVMVSGGYPESYAKGDIISGLENDSRAIVFHAGTKSANEDILSNGGRVLAITSLGEGIQEALDGSYERISGISWKNCYYRRDIGQDLLSWS